MRLLRTNKNDTRLVCMGVNRTVWDNLSDEYTYLLYILHVVSWSHNYYYYMLEHTRWHKTWSQWHMAHMAIIQHNLRVYWTESIPSIPVLCVCVWLSSWHCAPCTLVYVSIYALNEFIPLLSCAWKWLWLWLNSLTMMLWNSNTNCRFYSIMVFRASNTS